MFSKQRAADEFFDKATMAQKRLNKRLDRVKMDRLPTRKEESQGGFRKFFFAGLAAGALSMFLFDPRTGKRRRALVRDKAVHFGHTVDDAVTEGLPKKIKYVSGFAQGASHKVGSMTDSESHASDDDKTITDRVMSSVFRDPDIPSGQVNVNTVDHVVYLRGSLEGEDRVKEIEDKTRKVAGVRDVVNLINRPEVDPSEVHPGMDANPA